MITMALLLTATAAPAKTVPLTNPAGWVTMNDYPPMAQRDGMEGTTTFRLEISPKGAVAKCAVTISSGSQLLDDTTCRLISERARFAPARDRNGHAVAGSYQNRVRWVMRRSPLEPFPFARQPFSVMVRLEIDEGGKTIGCTYTGPLSVDAGVRLCEATKAAQATTPFTDASGKPVAKIVTLRNSISFEDR